MDTRVFLDHLRTQPFYRDQIVHIERIREQKARYGELEKPLVPALEEALQSRHFLPLYTHQAESVNHARNGKNVMVVTASASGKTMCYNIPVADRLAEDKHARALYLFPTKALAQDQLRAFRENFTPDLFSENDIDTFDGDTPRKERTFIRKNARILLSNPDMLHVGILPRHQQWSSFFRSLRYVVIDEAHVYRGVFGSHLTGVIRRLRRICRQYGAQPQFILASATIANPEELAHDLTGLDFTVVSGDGAPHGGRDFVFWNPPIDDELKGTRRSSNSEASSIFAQLIANDIRTMTFVRTRRLTELIFKYASDKLRKIKVSLAKKIKPYRAGYLAEDRRKIENDLFSGKLLGVVATTALELGIDIGGLDATVLTGYPGSIASTWQQAARSGRGKERSLSVLVGLDGPLDQYFMRHPDFFFGRNYENALVNPENPYILRAHLLCAAWERGLTESDAEYFGEAMHAEVRLLIDRGLLKERRGRWYLNTSVVYPAQSINIRSTSGENYSLIDMTTGALLETIEEDMAFAQAHTGAIYLHQGESYIIMKLDLESHTVYCMPSDAGYYTQSKDLSELKIIKVAREKKVGNTTVYLGEVEVTGTVIGYRKKSQLTDEVIGEDILELPSQTFPTVALWFDIPDTLQKRIDTKEHDFAGALHAVEHAAIGLLPLFALCDRNDIGGLSTPQHPDTGKAQIFIYDGHPGGVGIAEKGFQLVEKLWQATLDAVESCPCRAGCPSCIQSPKCGNNNKPLDKKAAQILLRGLMAKRSRT